ncbi:unnamed protein product [Knipowitschia caucasica]|uniref:Myb/SANT-like DNA-binding domain-containing protein n=1 Tax=Knipowitschia caucasica TaxID=637954 RepID=A0AAV2J592_KNICA
MSSFKGSRWSDLETECLIEIWSDTSIQYMLDRTHKNTVVFKQISKYLAERGFSRSVVQCRDKLKKLRTRYHRVRRLMSKSGSSAEEKENFPWYEAVDGILGTKPTTRPKVLESNRPVQLISAEQSPETDTSLIEERAVTPLEMPEPAAMSTPGPRLTATSRPGLQPTATSTPHAADMSGSTETVAEVNVPSTSSAKLERLSLGHKRKRVQEPAFEAHMETQRMLADFMQAEERRHAEWMQREERFRHEDSSRADMRLERMMQHQTSLIQMLLAAQNTTPQTVTSTSNEGGAPGEF